ncbi:MAG: TIGR03086 family metal-binding protein [Mycobacteriaceae bacterium]
MADNMVKDESYVSARELLPGAFDHFSELVHRIPSGAWGNDTPCSDWTVRELVNHLTAEHLWAPRLLAGESIEQVGSAYDGDVLGDDPQAAWDSAAHASHKAWAAADDQTPVTLSFGETTAAEYAEQMLLDLTVHAWDLARGAQIAEGRVSAEAVLHVLDYARGKGFSSTGLFAPEIATDSDQPQDQLVAMLGRRP